MASLFFNHFSSPTSKKGFSLIEIIIVVAIVGILAVLAVGAYLKGIERAKKTRAQSDLDRIAKAIKELELDTMFGPGHANSSDCVYQIIRFALSNDPDGTGLVSAAATWSNWKGPYLDKLPLDPWNQSYFYDTNYECRTDTLGCENYPDLLRVRAIYSGGANRTTAGVFDTDNVVKVLCRE